MKTIKSILSVLTAILTLSVLFTLTGCGSRNDQKATEAPTAPTVTSTSTGSQVTATQAPAGNQDTSETQAPVTSRAEDSETDEDGYISRETAIANVKQLAGSGAQILDAYKGYSPENLPAWVVTVAPITRSDEAVTVTYYSGYQFCYPEQEEAQEEEDSYISREDAIANVKQMAGSGAQIVDAYQGYSPDGLPAWVITVIPISASDEAGTVTYYSGYQFCYPAE